MGVCVRLWPDVAGRDDAEDHRGADQPCTNTAGRHARVDHALLGGVLVLSTELRLRPLPPAYFSFRPARTLGFPCPFLGFWGPPVPHTLVDIDWTFGRCPPPINGLLPPRSSVDRQTDTHRAHAPEAWLHTHSTVSLRIRLFISNNTSHNTHTQTRMLGARLS